MEWHTLCLSLGLFQSLNPMKQNSTLIRLDAFDNLEMLSMNEQQRDFPEHYHETYCISLLESGCEQIRTNGNTIIGTSGAITISNPYEVHANPLIDNDINLSFKTIYPSKELIKFYNDNRLAVFGNTPILDSTLSHYFQIIAKKIKKGGDAIDSNQEEFQQLINSFFRRLLRYQQSNFTSPEKYSLHSSKIEEVKAYILSNIDKKITLEDLAKIYRLDIYNFSKKFKASSGLSPINYALLIKTLEAKKRLCKKERMSDVVYGLGFFDQAHFSNTFKKFIGTSPKSYLQH